MAIDAATRVHCRRGGAGYARIARYAGIAILDPSARSLS
jgi:hypothetical protein